MDEQSQNKLNEILGKEILALTPGEIAFLKARRSYLSELQIEIFAEVLEQDIPRVEPVAPEVTTNTSTLSYRDLQKKARGYGLKYVGVSKDDLLKSIDTVEGPGGADKPL
jgi:hypothetical protein